MQTVEPEIIENEQQIAAVVAVAQQEVKALVITDDASLQAAVDMGGKVKTRINRIKAWFKPLTTAAFEAHRKLTKAEKDAIAPLEALERQIKDAHIAYTDKRERERAEEIKKAQAKADADAKAERERLAQEKEAFEGPEAAAEVRSAPPPPVVSASIPPPNVTKPKGAAVTTTWRHEVIDAAKVPREYLMVDEKKLAGYAKAMKEGANVPGVRFYPDKDVSLRAS